MEPIANLDINLPWIIPVETTKGLAVIEFDAAVRHVERIERCRKAFAKVFAQGDIECRVPGQVISRIGLALEGVAETGTVVHVGRNVGAPRERNVATNIKGIALIVVERTESSRRKWITDIAGEVREPSVNAAAAFGDLVGVCEMELPAMGDAGRPHGNFPPSNFGSVDCYR